MTCPACGSETVPVLYGMPADFEALDALVASGRAVHRGCSLPGGELPAETCPACGLDLDRDGRPIEP